jgi:NtrC-family two-component system response regulator AlgB
LLAEHFLARARVVDKKLDGFDDEATAWLLQHRWPGNVPELENVVERAALSGRTGPVRDAAFLVADAPCTIRPAGRPDGRHAVAVATRCRAAGKRPPAPRTS